MSRVFVTGAGLIPAVGETAVRIDSTLFQKSLEA